MEASGYGAMGKEGLVEGGDWQTSHWSRQEVGGRGEEVAGGSNCRGQQATSPQTFASGGQQ